MNEKFIVDRITQLRLERNISEYELSYSLGFSKSYVNMISREKNLPSMNAFLAICDYFEITPAQFFVPYLDGEMEELLHMFLDLKPEDREKVKDIMSAIVIKRAVEAHESNPPSNPEDKK